MRRFRRFHEYLEESTVLAAGMPLDLSSSRELANVVPMSQNLRYDSSAGRLTAELSVQNRAEPVARNLAIVFPDLPANVTLVNPSGLTADGSPYLSLKPGIVSGGLDSGQHSGVFLVELHNPENIAFPLAMQTFGSANQPPVLEAVEPAYQVKPGEALQIQLVARDADGDQLIYRISSDGSLPNGTFSEGFMEMRPTPEQVGTYPVEFSVSDGMNSVSQTTTITVIPDELPTSRLTGIVRDTDGAPLADLATVPERPGNT